MRYTIHNVHIVTEEAVRPGSLVIEDGTIDAVYFSDSTHSVEANERQRRAGSPDETVINGEGGYLLPGPIDLHIHGANGHDLMDGTEGSVQAVSEALAGHGCTSFLATSVTASETATTRFIEAVSTVRGKEIGAQIAGIHLEGPYLNRVKKGMQSEEHLRRPDIEEMRRWIAAGQGLIKMVTLAPELDGASELIEELRRQDIIVAVAHSDATYEQAKRAFALGARHVTHCFNAMRSIHHREPGIVIAAFEEPHVTCEAIVDGHHLHPAIVRMMHRNLGRERMALVTDAMQAMGLGDGEYTFGGHAVTVKDGVATLRDGTLASSTVTMVNSIRNAVSFGIDFSSAVHMASATPARILNLVRVGVIREGMLAHLVLLQSDFSLSKVFVGQQCVSVLQS